MKNFPSVSNNKVILLRAQNATGIVLDDNFLIKASEEQNIYTVFESLADADQYITEKSKEHEGVDFTVFANDGSIVLYRQNFTKEN